MILPPNPRLAPPRDESPLAQHRRKLFATARERGLDNKDLHTVIYRITGKNSIKQMDLPEFQKVLDFIQANPQPNRISDKQLNYAIALARSLGWKDPNGFTDRTRLEGFAKERFGAESLERMRGKEASKLIEGLKAMVDRSSGKAAADPAPPPHETDA